MVASASRSVVRFSPRRTLNGVVSGRKLSAVRLHLIGARRQVLEHRDAAIVDRRGLLDAARVDDRDLRDDERRVGLIEHGDAQRRAHAGALHHLRRRDRRDRDERQRERNVSRAMHIDLLNPTVSNRI